MLSFLLLAFRFRTAQSVKRGDYIFTTKYCTRGLCAERVVELSLSVKQGKHEIYTPHKINILNIVKYIFVKQAKYEINMKKVT